MGPAKVRGFEILKMEDRSKGMSSGKLFWMTYRCYKNKKWVELGAWVLGKNEEDCRRIALDRYRKD